MSLLTNISSKSCCENIKNNLLSLEPLKTSSEKTLIKEIFKQHLEGGCEEFQFLAKKVSTLKTMRENLINGKVHVERFKAILICVSTALLTAGLATLCFVSISLIILNPLSIYPLGLTIPAAIGGSVFFGYSIKHACEVFKSKERIEKELNAIAEQSLSSTYLTHLQNMESAIHEKIHCLEDEKNKISALILKKQRLGISHAFITEEYRHLEERIKSLQAAGEDMRRFHEQIQKIFFQ